MAATLAATGWVRAPKTLKDGSVDLGRFPKQFAGWSARDDSLDETTKMALRTNQVLLRYYTDMNGRRVELFIGYYQDQRFGAQVHSPIHCLPGSGWTILRHDKMLLPFATNAAIANKLHINKDGNNQFVVYWFASNGDIVKNEFDLKIRLLLNALKRETTSVYFYRISVAFAENGEGVALQSVQEFLKVASSYLDGISCS
jgi:EpsI family protein